MTPDVARLAIESFRAFWRRFLELRRRRAIVGEAPGIETALFGGGQRHDASGGETHGTRKRQLHSDPPDDQSQGAAEGGAR